MKSTRVVVSMTLSGSWHRPIEAKQQLPIPGNLALPKHQQQQQARSVKIPPANPPQVPSTASIRSLIHLRRTSIELDIPSNNHCAFTIPLFVSAQTRSFPYAFALLLCSYRFGLFSARRSPHSCCDGASVLHLPPTSARAVCATSTAVCRQHIPFQS